MRSGGSQHRGPVEAMALGTREVGLPVLDIGASRVPSTPQGPGHPFLRSPPELPQLSDSHPTPRAKRELAVRGLRRSAGLPAPTLRPIARSGRSAPSGRAPRLAGGGARWTV